MCRALRTPRFATPFAIPALLLLASCATRQSVLVPMPEATVAYAAAPLQAPHPDWSRDAVIYEVNVRQFTPEGTFDALTAHLPRLDSLGVDILWLMPVQPIGKVNRKGGLGSYYSIADYTAVNPELGTRADFREFVDAAHRAGLRVILDWVANHSAFDNVWAREHRDWYTLRPDGSISVARDLEGKETDWTDVADLDYDNPELRQAMLRAMRWWVDSMNVDGFRADVAGFVPYDFWATMRSEMKAIRSDFFLLAEWEDPKLHASFDMTYGWELHALLNRIARGEAGVDEIDRYLAKQDSTYPPDAYRMYFTSNHDENSWNGSELERMGANHVPAFVLAATLRNSMPLLYTGQEASLSKRLRFFDKDTVDWSGPSLAGFYRSIFDLRHTQPALRNGAAGGAGERLRTEGSERVYAFTRTRGTNTVLVAVNFGDAARVSYDALPLPGDYTDWTTKAMVALPYSGTIDVPAHGYRILVR